jgi:hypothetical protein
MQKVRFVVVLIVGPAKARFVTIHAESAPAASSI